jgi:hypothetical protein
MKTAIASALAAVTMLAASSLAHAQQGYDENDVVVDQRGSMSDRRDTGSIRAPDGSYDIRSFCNSTPDDAKCRALGMGEINKGN